MHTTLFKFIFVKKKKKKMENTIIFLPLHYYVLLCVVKYQQNAFNFVSVKSSYENSKGTITFSRH